MGDTLALFAAGAALLALLFASYSRRSTWLAFGSSALSMVALIGCLFVAMSHDASHIRTRLAWVGSKLQPVLDRPTVDGLKTALDYVWTSSSCAAGPPCKKTASAEPFTAEPSPPKPPAAEPAATEPAPAEPAAIAASISSWFGSKQDAQPTKPDAQSTKQDSTAAPAYPVAWRLDEPHVQVSSSSTAEFLISGTNVADHALEDVHAVLKPDASKRELDLALNVEGRNADGGAVIPAGARFSLVAETPNDGATLGGAILAFRYVEAGQHKSSILYLTPSMVGRLANRG